MKKFAAFDIDGTLIRWQLYHAVVDKMASKGLLGAGAKEKLHEARMQWKRREEIDSFRTYEMTLIGVYEDALGDITPEQFDQAVTEVAHEYKAQTYTYTRDLVRDLKKQGYVLLAISGSHNELVAHIAEQYGFDYWVGTDYKRKDNQFTGEKFVASFDKKTILKNLVGGHHLTFEGSIAIGDSRSDAAMLELVEQPIAFNPDKDLYERAVKEGWKIVIERKNVIYQLEKHGSDYRVILDT